MIVLKTICFSVKETGKILSLVMVAKRKVLQPQKTITPRKRTQVYIFMSVCLSVCLCLSSCLSVCLSVCLPDCLEPQKLVTFGILLHPINHKNCRSRNLVLMTLGDTSTHNSHFTGKSLSPHPKIN